MGTVTKLNNVLCANISKVDNVLKSNASKWDDNTFCPTPTPTPTTPVGTPTPTPTITLTQTPTLTRTLTPTPTNTPTLTQTLTPTPTNTPTLTQTLTPTPTPTSTQAGSTPTPTPTTPECSPGCCYAELCVSLGVSGDCKKACACQDILPYYLGMPCDTDPCDLANALAIYTNDDCSTKAPAGYYSDGTVCVQWNGNAIVSNIPC